MNKQEIIKEIESIFPLMERMQEYDNRMVSIQNKINEADENIKRKTSLRVLISNFMAGFLLIGYLAALITHGSQIAFYVFGIAGGIFSFKFIANLRGPKKDIEEKERLEKEFKEIDQQLIEELGDRYVEAIKIIPSDYAYPECVYALHSYLVNGRADSLKEAINLFEEEQHRMRVEENQSRMDDKMREMEQIQESLDARVTMAETEINNRRF